MEHQLTIADGAELQEVLHSTGLMKIIYLSSPHRNDISDIAFQTVVEIRGRFDAEGRDSGFSSLEMGEDRTHVVER